MGQDMEIRQVEEEHYTPTISVIITQPPEMQPYFPISMVLKILHLDPSPFIQTEEAIIQLVVMRHLLPIQLVEAIQHLVLLHYYITRMVP